MDKSSYNNEININNRFRFIKDYETKQLYDNNNNNFKLFELTKFYYILTIINYSLWIFSILFRLNLNILLVD